MDQVTTQDWYVRNSGRLYPLDDNASGLGTSGTRLPDGFLVDANIWVPEYEYESGRKLQYIFISSASVSEHLVSLTILGSHYPLVNTDGDPTASVTEDFVPIASCTISRTAALYTPQPVEALLEGVMGWVVFGGAVNTTQFSELFTPLGSMLVPRAARYYTAPPVTAVNGDTGFNNLIGDIRLLYAAPLSISKQQVILGGEEQPRDAFVFELNADRATLDAYTGPCGGRPESGTCNHTPMTSFGGTSPNCAGNVNLVVNGAEVHYKEGGGGLCLDIDISTADACAAKNSANLADEYGNLPGTVDPATPCELARPFSTNDTDELITIEGSWYSFDSKIYGDFGGEEFIRLETCLEAIPIDQTQGAVSCRHYLYDLPYEDQGHAGIFIMRQTVLDRQMAVTLRVLDRHTEPLGEGYPDVELSTVELTFWTIDMTTNAFTKVGTANKLYEQSPPADLLLTTKAVVDTDHTIRAYLDGGSMLSAPIPDKFYSAGGVSGLCVIDYNDIAPISGVFSLFSVEE